MVITIAKGSRVRANVIKAQPIGSHSLSGMQMKVDAEIRTIVGTVTHVWGNDPVNPTKYEIAIRPDGETEDVVVDPSAIVACLEPSGHEVRR